MHCRTFALLNCLLISGLLHKIGKMDIKEFLLNGKTFLALLNDFAIDAKNVVIHGEDAIMMAMEKSQKEILKENICIEAKNDTSSFNLFGTLHCNILNKLAVFEMDGYEKVELVEN